LNSAVLIHYHPGIIISNYMKSISDVPTFGTILKSVSGHAMTGLKELVKL